MIQNFWNNISFYCINGHEEPVPMVVMEGSSAFYACPKYMLKDEKHPDGHEPDERACPNRISFIRANTIVEKFMKRVEADNTDNMFMDYTNMEFKYDGITVRILKYSPTDVRIGIINKRAFK